MSIYKLSYFNTRGLGEISRYVFAQAGVKFEDNRITKEEWPKVKPTTPFGMIPVLEEDGKKLAGGRVIARYLAEKPEFNLAGSNAFENAEIASIADVIDSYAVEIMKVRFEEDEARKKELLKVFLETTAPKYLGILQKQLQNNNGYLWGGKLTWPDLYLAVILDLTYEHLKEVYDKYPELVQLKERVESLPNIAKWLNERPKEDQ